MDDAPWRLNYSRTAMIEPTTLNLGIWGALPPTLLAILFAVSVVAGGIDAIAGGGGLLCLPALLSAGLTPAQTLATNKLQSSFGSSSATWNFHRKGAIDLKAMRLAILTVFAGAAAGTLVVQRIDPGFLKSALPPALVAIAAYFLFKPNLGDEDRHHRISLETFTLTMAPLIGFYDGFFGPGAGSFYAIAMVELLGFNLTRATANTKLLNLTSNIAAVLAFLLGGQIVWSAGLVMALGQFIGGRVGSHLVLKKGARLVRPLLVVMSLAMTVKLVAADEQNWAHRLALSLWRQVAGG
jgi:uncharacterized membrane protein YfcA